MSDRNLNRRQFLELSAAGAVALTASTALAQSDVSAPVPAPAGSPGRVVRVEHSGALSDPSRVDSEPLFDVVGLMVDTALLALTGRGDVAAAWRELVHPEDRVLLKVNALGSPRMATNVAVTAAIIRGLQTMGLPNDHMLVYDQFRPRMLRAGYRPGEPLLGVPVEASDDQGYAEQATEHGAGASRFAVAVRRATAIIDLPVFKDHPICGVTAAMKNLTHGVIDNPSALHPRHSTDPDDPCSVHADLWTTELIGPKVRVIVADGLRIQYHGGPQNNDHKDVHNAIYASTDPVAVDTLAVDLIDAARRAHGLPSLAEDGRACPWLAVAEARGLGVHDRARIQLETHLLA